MVVRHICAFAAILALIGCSDPKTANERNFQKALQDYKDYETTNGNYCIGKGPYPHEFLGDYPYLLEENGFIVKIGKQTKNLGLIGMVVDIYDLTAKGRQLFVEGRGFCYGNPVVMRITNFTEPSSMFGQTISKVNYEYRFENIPEWALGLVKKHKSDELPSELIKAVTSILNPIKEQAVLILTNKGWVHQTLFKTAG